MVLIVGVVIERDWNSDTRKVTVVVLLYILVQEVWFESWPGYAIHTELYCGFPFQTLDKPIIHDHISLTFS
jgi:hypothetical protein